MIYQNIKMIYNMNRVEEILYKNKNKNRNIKYIITYVSMYIVKEAQEVNQFAGIYSIKSSKCGINSTRNVVGS